MQHQCLSGGQLRPEPQLAVGAEPVETHGRKVAVVQFLEGIVEDICFGAISQHLVGESDDCLMDIDEGAPE